MWTGSMPLVHTQLMGYCKPRGSEPTRHLFIGNTGPAVGVSLSQIHAELQSFGSLEELTAPEEAQGRVFASFVTADQAQAACKSAKAVAASLGGRPLVFKYAALESELQVGERLSYCSVQPGKTQHLLCPAGAAVPGECASLCPRTGSRHRGARPAVAA